MTEFCLRKKNPCLVPAQLFYVLFPLIPLAPHLPVALRGLLKYLQIPRVFHNQIGISLVGLRSLQLAFFPEILVLFRFLVENSNRLPLGVRHFVQESTPAESPHLEY